MKQNNETFHSSFFHCIYARHCIYVTMHACIGTYTRFSSRHLNGYYQQQERRGAISPQHSLFWVLLLFFFKINTETQKDSFMQFSSSPCKHIIASQKPVICSFCSLYTHTNSPHLPLMLPPIIYIFYQFYFCYSSSSSSVRSSVRFYYYFIHAA